jgi:hypothetical protein
MATTEINAMNLKEVNAAIALAETHLVSLKSEARELLETIVALTDRRRRLIATARNIERVNVALSAAALRQCTGAVEVTVDDGRGNTATSPEVAQ